MKENQKKCIFWDDEFDKTCYWAVLRQKDIKERVLIGGLLFKVCIDGTGIYPHSMNTITRCKFMQKNE